MTTIPEKIETPLHSFIEDNHNLLSALAVLSGLIAFFSTLHVSLIASSTSFLFILAMIMIFRELQDRTPKLRSFTYKTLRLFIFSYSIILAGYIVVIYSLLKYREVSHFGLFIPLTFVTYSFTVFILKDPVQTILAVPLLRKYFYTKDGEYTLLFKRIAKFCAAVVALFCLYFGAGLSQPFNYVLDQISAVMFAIPKE